MADGTVPGARSASPAGADVKTLVIALLCLAGLAGWCSAESASGGASGSGSSAASAHLDFRIVVPPVFKVLQATPVAGGTEYRVARSTSRIGCIGFTRSANRCCVWRRRKTW